MSTTFTRYLAQVRNRINLRLSLHGYFYFFLFFQMVFEDVRKSVVCLKLCFIRSSRNLYYLKWKLSCVSYYKLWLFGVQKINVLSSVVFGYDYNSNTSNVSISA